jgi:hypothetical protein
LYVLIDCCVHIPLTHGLDEQTCIIFSQYIPYVPLGQRQLETPGNVMKHVPELEHGLDEQGE